MSEDANGANDPLPGIPEGTYDGSPDRPVRYAGLAGLSWLSQSETSWLIERLPDAGLFVEVGSASGVTAALIADAKPRLTIICVDTFADSDDPHVAEAEPGRLANWKANAKGRPNLSLWLGDFASFCHLSPLARPLAILVDADHSEAGALADLEYAGALLAPGGTLFVHDCDEPAHPGVNVAVARFCERSGFEADGQHWTLRALRRR